MLMCGTVCVSQSPWCWSHTLFRMCTCIRTSIYVHLTAHVCSTSYAVWWKPRCPCVAQGLCTSHPTCGTTPWLECVHASVHVVMSIQLCMSASPHLHTNMETWVPLCCTVCSSHSVPMPWLECGYASVHVHLCLLHPYA